MSAHVSFNLLYELRERDKMHGFVVDSIVVSNADLFKSVFDYYKRMRYNTVTILIFDIGGTNDIR